METAGPDHGGRRDDHRHEGRRSGDDPEDVLVHIDVLCSSLPNQFGPSRSKARQEFVTFEGAPYELADRGFLSLRASREAASSVLGQPDRQGFHSAHQVQLPNLRRRSARPQEVEAHHRERDLVVLYALRCSHLEELDQNVGPHGVVDLRNLLSRLNQLKAL